MRYYPAIAILLLVACAEPELLPDNELIAQMPTAMQIPQCVAIDADERNFTNHVRDDKGFRESLYFRGSKQCIDSWEDSLADSSSDEVAMYFKGDESGYVMVMRVNNRSAPNGDRAFVQWLHPNAILGVSYYDGRENE